MADLVDAITRRTPIAPDFVDGLKVQCVLEAVEKSIEERRWTRVVVPEV